MQLHHLPQTKIYKKNSDVSTKSLDMSIPQIMGILNVTPDSFSDGGKFNSLDSALIRCEQMIEEGASIIDIGGESTRPNASPVAVDEECDRVVPIVEAIRKRFGTEIWLSIDTSTPSVIQHAVEVGADIWNDVRALSREHAPEVAAKLEIPVILMHMRGEPTTMNDKAHYENVVNEVIAELQTRIDTAVEAGVKKHNIIIDPGFGFAKNYSQHMTLLNELSKFHRLQLPLLFGVSRKRFLGDILNKSQIPIFQDHQPLDRDGVGMAAALLAVQQGASIIRTHNVELTSQGLSLWHQLTSSSTKA